ncbi:chemotaxis-specific protein-glutamate methyltransferase CheB [Roseateles amylovorans]|uniref:Protein-glutamate methylesterase/protein-glutamine glutaminase n=1 Tax=Roseateles amylovorans TaxID=2978473 RepID=A0ABY6AWK1_9BURK|nr:chemotaxis-specific protein-glutamate methyltransferase CheB [Roseateles amylovorans]UXH77352.1 chemotaxis-specific protein-glutamate methyltransferase CheB [Roseateles amylovorans]
MSANSRGGGLSGSFPTDGAGGSGASGGTSGTKPLRVLLVEDSPTVLAHIRDVLQGHRDIEIVGEAHDGSQAVTLCQRLRPDVISMDMMLPGMDGQAATEAIMAHCPTPILIVSSSTNRGELLRTYEALAAGAVEVLEKPNGRQPEGEWERRYVTLLRLVARIRVITHVRARLQRPPSVPGPAQSRRAVLALGASTGGPGALMQILQALPVPAPLPVLIVMHINAVFSRGFAEWLDGQTHHNVRYARGGEALRETVGQVILAPPDSHLIVNQGLLQLSHVPPRHSCRPSVDVLFESLAAELGSGVVAALLTGMGRDGAQGLLEIRRAGGATLAQDEASSMVYGMPREAAQLGAAERILPLNEIGPTLVALSGMSWGGHTK